MRALFKKIAFGVGIFVLASIIGCSNQTQVGSADSLRCNATSRGRMAEVEDGFFWKVDNILYYADKTDLSNWVAVCNNPDCTHGEYVGDKRGDCQGRAAANSLVQKENQLYYYSVDESVGNEWYVWELTQDGSGSRKVFTLPFTDEMRHATQSNHFSQNNLIVMLNGITEDGYDYYEFVRLNEEKELETIFYGMVSEDGTKTGKDFITEDSQWYSLTGFVVSGAVMYGINGEDVLTATQTIDGQSVTELWRVNQDSLEKVNLPQGTPLLHAYITEDCYTYFEEDKGFCQIDLATGEEILLWENQLEHSVGFVMTEEYMIESTCAVSGWQEKGEALVKFYNGEEWIDVSLPESVANSEKALYPFSVAKDRIFFRQNMNRGFRERLYYMMLEDETPELIFCAEVGDEPDLFDPALNGEGETSSDEVSESEFEKITIFDNADTLFQITDAKAQGNNFVIDVYWDVKNLESNYMIQTQAIVNGIKCDPGKWFVAEQQKEAIDSKGEKAKIDEIVFDSGAFGALTQSGILDIYEINEITDIELIFTMSDDITDFTVEEKSVHIYPQGKEQATKYTREPQSTDVMVVDNEWITMIATSYENDEVTMFIQNKTDKDVRFQVDGIYVNGFMPYAGSAEVVTINGGSCRFRKVSIPNLKTLEQYGITEIDKIELLTRIFVYDEGIGEDLANEVVTLYQNGTEQVTQYVRPSQETDQILMDNEYVTLILTGYTDFEYYDGTTVENLMMDMYLINKTDKMLTFQVGECSVNGLTGKQYKEQIHVAPYGSRTFTVESGERMDLIEFGVKTITKIDLIYRVYAYGGGAIGEDFVTERIVLYPEGEELVTLFVRQEQDTDKVLLDNEKITVLVTEAMESRTVKNGLIYFYIKNKTSEDIKVVMEDVLVNGCEIGKIRADILDTYLYAGECSKGTVEVAQVALANGMTEVEVLEFIIRVYPLHYADGIVGEDVVKETITLRP